MMPFNIIAKQKSEIHFRTTEFYTKWNKTDNDKLKTWPYIFKKSMEFWTIVFVRALSIKYTAE